MWLKIVEWINTVELAVFKFLRIMIHIEVLKIKKSIEKRLKKCGKSFFLLIFKKK